MRGGPGADWRSPEPYGELLLADRRAFAWEWLRRNATYRRHWMTRGEAAAEGPELFGLLGWVDPALSARVARPIWSIDRDPHVLRARPAFCAAPAEDLFDVRSVAPFVSVEIDAKRREHWLMSDGRWAIRLDLFDGTLLGDPVLVEHRISGLQSAKPKQVALRQFIVLAQNGGLPRSMMPKENKAAQWILELRVGDAVMAGANQQEIARRLFGGAISPKRWRTENPSYRSRVQRLVKRANSLLGDPFAGPWFA